MQANSLYFVLVLAAEFEHAVSYNIQTRKGVSGLAALADQLLLQSQLNPCQLVLIVLLLLVLQFGIYVCLAKSLLRGVPSEKGIAMGKTLLDSFVCDRLQLHILLLGLSHALLFFPFQIVRPQMHDQSRHRKSLPNQSPDQHSQSKQRSTGPLERSAHQKQDKSDGRQQLAVEGSDAVKRE